MVASLPAWNLMALTCLAGGCLVLGLSWWRCAGALARATARLEAERLEVQKKLNEAAYSQAQAQERAQQLVEAAAENSRKDGVIAALNSASNGLQQELTALKTRARAEQEAFDALKGSFEEARSALIDQFKALSADSLRQSNQSFLELAQSAFGRFSQQAQGEFEKKHVQIDSSLKPIQEALHRFDGKLGELEKTRTEAYAGISAQIAYMSDANDKLKTETANLVKALRTPHVRGQWGEMQLRRVVEMAGMIDHCDFVEQASTVGEDGRLRPDLQVRLPGGKVIVVDAKAVINAYIEAAQATLETERKAKLQEHARHIRQRVSELSRKAYWEQFENSPEFVVLFLPGEALFSSALESDPALIEQSVGQKVIIATPTTLIALLKAVAYGWKQTLLARNAEEISSLGRELHKRINDMTGHFAGLGQKLGAAVDHYNKTLGSFESRVLVTARKFQELHASRDDREIQKIEPVDKLARSMNWAPEA